jgi:outer membrane lipoprotein-sorting protein
MTLSRQFSLGGLLVLSLLSGQFCRAQDFGQTMAQMKKRYEQSQQFHVVMRVKAYEKADAAAPFYQQRAEIFKDGGNYLYRLTDNEMLMNNQHFLMVNKVTQQMVCRPRSVEDELKLRSQTALNLDSLLQFYDTPTYLGVKEQQHHYRLVQKTGEIRRIDLYFSTTDYLIKEIRYQYKSGQVATIAFVRFDLHPTFQANLFDEKRYVAQSKGKLKGVGAYSNYAVNE